MRTQVQLLYLNPLTAEGIIYASGQVQVLAEFESSIFDEV